LVSQPETAVVPPTSPAPLDVAALYRRYADTVASWAALLGGPVIEVADVVQEVFVIVHRRLRTFRGDAAVTTWLYSITQNVVRNRRRKERWRRWIGGSADELAAELAAPGPTPIEQLEQRRTTQMIYQVLEGLREKYRTVLILFEIEGLTGEEIARLTRTKLPTVWVRLHRARMQFVRRLQEQFPERLR